MMKRAAVVVLAMLLAVSLGSVAFAQTIRGDTPEAVFQQKLGAAKTINFEGEVLSHDVACHCIVLKGPKGTLTLQDDYAKFDQDYDRAKGIQKGAKIKGTYKVVDYINYAMEIHKE
jgi:hypothetical protein